MSVSEKLRSAVVSKNATQIRDALWSRIALDPNFSGGFAESWEYCIKNGISESEIYEPHDGREISYEANEANFNALCGQLRTNFSRERLDAIKKIGRGLYPKTQSEKPVVASSPSRRHKSKSDDKADYEEWIPVAAAVVGALAGGAAFKIAGAIIGAIVCGAAGYYLSKNENKDD